MRLLRALRRPGLVPVVGAVVFVDTMFYAAIAPLLPSLAHELHLSKLSAGLLTGSYPIGTFVAALPAGVLAARVGPKLTVLVGLALLAGSTLAFGFVNDVVALDVARLLEGIGGACSWAGGLAWIIAASPVERRGALIGGALAAAIAGALFGPVIGTAANAVGRGAAFSAVVLAAVLLAAAAMRLPSPRERSGQGWRDLGPVLSNRGILTAMWLVGLPALVAGLLDVLGPLRLHSLGAGAAAIGATFLCAAAIEAAMSPLTGRLSDRHGRLVPVRFGLAGAACMLLLFTLPEAPLPLAVVIAATTAALGAFWAPATALLSDLAEASSLDQGLAAALVNLAWAGGQIVGSGAGGAVAEVAGDELPMVIAAGLCAGSILALWRRSPLTMSTETSAG